MHIPLKAITNKKHYERNVFISPYSTTTSSLLPPYAIRRGKKKTLKNLKRVLIAAAGMTDLLKTVGSVFSDKRVLFINSVPFLSIFSFALYFAVPFGKAGYFHTLRGHICWLFLFLLCGITQKSVRAGFKRQAHGQPCLDWLKIRQKSNGL